jgi:hypothetical protein
MSNVAVIGKCGVFRDPPSGMGGVPCPRPERRFPILNTHRNFRFDLNIWCGKPAAQRLRFMTLYIYMDKYPRVQQISRFSLRTYADCVALCPSCCTGFVQPWVLKTTFYNNFYLARACSSSPAPLQWEPRGETTGFNCGKQRATTHAWVAT